MTWSLQERPLRSVLVSRLRYLGDVVMATAVLRALREGDPELKLGFLCEEAHAEVLRDHPLLDRLHALRARRRGADARARAAGDPGPGQQAAPGRGTMGIIGDLRGERYDLAVDLLFNPRSALLLRLAGVPLRIGGPRGWRRRLYTHVAGDDPAADAPVWRQAAPGGLGHHLGRLRLLRHDPSGLPFAQWLIKQRAGRPLLPSIPGWSPGPRGLAALQELGVRPGDGYVLLCPGATWRSKEWPARRWGELVQRLCGQGGPALVLLAPGPGPNAWRQEVPIPARRGGALDFLPLAEALGIVGGAAAVVTVDGGVMHAAVGMGVPTLALFGPTDPDVWFPYAGHGPFRVLATRPTCHPCDRHDCDNFVCLPDLQAEQAAVALLDLLAAAPSRERGSYGRGTSENAPGAPPAPPRRP